MVDRADGTQNLRRISGAAGACVAMIALVELAYWWFGLGSSWMGPTLSLLKANTALALLLAAAALVLMAWPGRLTLWAAVTASVATLIAALTLVQDLIPVDLGLDQLLARDESGDSAADPGRMAGQTAATLVAAGLSLLALWSSDRGAQPRQAAAGIGQVLAGLTGLVGYVALVGYAYKVEPLYMMSADRAMSPQTAASFVLLGVGGLFVRPELGLTGEMVLRRSGRVLSGRLMPLVLVVAPVAGWLRLRGEALGWYGTAFGTSLMVLGAVVMTAVAIVWSVRRLNRMAEAHDRSVQRGRESEARRTAIFESALDAIVAIDATGRVIDFNPAAEQIFGYTRREAIGREMAELIIPERLRGQHRDGLARFLSTGARHVLGRRIEMPAQRAGGEEFPAELAIVEVADGGTPVFVGHLRDISERRELERTLAEESDFRRRVIDNAVISVATLDREGRYTGVNPRFCEMVGYTREELVGSHFEMVIPPELRAEIRALYQSRIDLGVSTRERELEMVRKDGKRVAVLYGASPLYSGDRIIGVVSTLMDITERRQLEARLGQSQKLESLGRLAGGIAHDFNNMLTAVMGYASLLENELGPGDQRRERVRGIMAAAESAQALTAQLLAFARKQMLVPRVLSLTDIVARAEPMFRRLIPENVTILVRPAADLGTTLVDPGQMEQLLINLVVNAGDAMPGGGSLILETGNVTLDSNYTAQHADVAPGDYVMLAVSDTGTGMDRETISRIFEPFFTTKQLGRGTGLGLATCYGIVKQCRGDIWVYSEPGKGTTFKVYLPRSSSPAEALRGGPRAASSPRGGETILLAEDQPVVRQIVADSLHGLGYDVLVASDGEEAAALARSHRGPIDLLISDALMPRMSGRELAAAVRACHPEIKVLFISGYTAEMSVQTGVCEPGVSFLPKPFTPSALAGVVRELLESSPR